MVCETSVGAGMVCETSVKGVVVCKTHLIHVLNLLDRCLLFFSLECDSCPGYHLRTLPQGAVCCDKLFCVAHHRVELCYMWGGECVGVMHQPRQPHTDGHVT